MINSAIKIVICFSILFNQTIAVAQTHTQAQTKLTKSEKQEQAKENNKENIRESSEKSIVPRSFPDDTKFLDAIDYPELQVVPRASDRLIEEAQFEKDYGLFTHWTFWTSGGATLITSLMHNSKSRLANPTDQDNLDAQNATKFAMTVGAGTIALGMALYLMHPYGSQVENLKKIRASGKRGELYRERIAEEGMEKIAKYVTIITYLTPIANFVTSANVYEKADDNTRLYAGISMLTSMLPLIFRNPYITNYEKHLEYKRKIYAPLISSTVLPVSGEGYIPALAATWVF